MLGLTGLSTMDSMFQLKQMIASEGIVVSKEPFTLSGGGKSNYYYDIKNVIQDPMGLDIVGNIGLKIARLLDVKSVGGIESGSLPIAASIAVKSYNSSYASLPMFYVRKKAKEYGLKKTIEGHVKSPVLLVEDVVNEGMNIINAIEQVVKAGREVSAVLVVVDRNNGGRELVRSRGIDYLPLFTNDDFLLDIKAKVKDLNK